MNWWQMAFIEQMALITVVSVTIGLLLGYLLSYLVITRVLKEPFKKPFAKKRETTGQQVREQAEERGRGEAAVVKGLLESIALDLVGEVENNHRIATAPWTGKLLAFQTHVWDTSVDKTRLSPASLREDLTQAYVDMRLANNIVWSSMEFGARSPTLDNHYVKLCTNIAVKLNRIAPLLK